MQPKILSDEAGTEQKEMIWRWECIAQYLHNKENWLFEVTIE